MRQWWREFPKMYKLILAVLSIGVLLDIYFYFVSKVMT